MSSDLHDRPGVTSAWLLMRWRERARILASRRTDGQDCSYRVVLQQADNHDSLTRVPFTVTYHLTLCYPRDVGQRLEGQEQEESVMRMSVRACDHLAASVAGNKDCFVPAKA